MKKICFILTALLMLASCIRVDIPDNVSNYRNLFESKVGVISEDQNWDFYEAYVNEVMSASTKAGDVSFTRISQDRKTDYTKWQKMLKSDVDNRDKGATDFSLVSGGSFKVYPVWYAGWYPVYREYSFEMGIIVNGVKTKIFEGLNQNRRPSGSQEDYSRNPGTGAAVTIPAGTEYAFYMQYVDGGVTHMVTSDTNALLLYSNLIDETKMTMVIGMEDNDASEWDTNVPDFNDVVLYIEGDPYLPLTKSKRFMCEDCGTAGDFDFNDLVMDVQVQGTEGSTTTLGVTIQAAGGTIPLYVQVAGQTIGEAHDLLGVSRGTVANTGFSEVISPYHTTVKAEGIIDITSFTDITVITGAGSSTMYSFPAEGRAPYMIAVPTSVSWVRECSSIKAGYPDFFNDNWMDNFDENYLYSALK